MPLLLRGDLVLLGPAGQQLDDGAVLIQGDSITAVGPYQQVRGGHAAEWLEGEDFEERHFPVLAPGLINAHVHLAFDENARDPAGPVKAGDHERVGYLMEAHARQLLGAGVTTARDLGGPTQLSIALRDRIAAHDTVGPRLLVATAPITPPGGHCWFLGGEVDTDESSLREAVHRRATAGADVVKVMASGGRMTSTGPPIWTSQFTFDQLSVVVDEAHRDGLPVAAHCHGADSIEDATLAGVDTVEHCGWRIEGGRFDPRDRVAREMATRGTVVCPTPTPNWRRLARKIGEERAESYHRRVRWLDENGVILICGSDAGTRNANFTDFVSSLEALAHVGLSKSRIIDLVTATAARVLRLPTGRLARGLTADVIALDADPTIKLEILRYPRAIVRSGRVHGGQSS